MRFALILFAASLSATELLDLEMSNEEKKKSGVYKLSKKQKGALQLWIDTHYEKRDEPREKTGPLKGELQQVLNNGQIIVLSDGSHWVIHASDTPITQSWITAVEILVSDTKDLEYPHRLTNSLTGSAVRAQLAQP